MRVFRSLSAKLLALFILLSCQVHGLIWAQSSLAPDEAHSRAHKSAVSPLPNGIEVKAGDLKFTCRMITDGMSLSISSHEGSYPAWWQQVHVEIYGFTPKLGEVYVNTKKISAHIDTEPQSLGFVIEDDGNGEEIEIR